MKHLLLLFFILLITSCNPTFEKDGGTRITLEAKGADKTQMDRIMLILAKRIDLFGIIKPNIRIGKSPTEIIIELPGKFDNERLRKVLQSSAKLEFWETYENKEVYEKIVLLNTRLSEELFPELKDTLTSREVSLAMASKASPQFAAQKSDKEIEEEKMEKIKKQNPLFALFNPAYRFNHRQEPEGLADGPVVGYALVKDTAQVNKYFSSATAKKILGSTVKFLWEIKPMDQNQKVYSLVAIKVNRTGKAALWEDVVEDANVMNSEWGPQISMRLTKVAAMDWQKMTRENIGKAIAIVLDDQVYSYPIVNSEIEGGQASISGNFTQQEAQDFANVLKAGYLPVAISIVQEEVVAAGK